MKTKKPKYEITDETRRMLQVDYFQLLNECRLIKQQSDNLLMRLDAVYHQVGIVAQKMENAGIAIQRELGKQSKRRRK